MRINLCTGAIFCYYNFIMMKFYPRIRTASVKNSGAERNSPFGVGVCTFSALFLLVFVAFFAIIPHYASAHEQYVITKAQFDADYADSSINVFDALKTPENLTIAVEVGAGTLLLFLLYFIFLGSRLAPFLDRTLIRLEPTGHALIRIAVGLSLIYSSITSVYLGPEIPLSSFPLGPIIHYGLFITGVLLVFGFLSEFAGLASLLIMLVAAWVYKDYMFSYFGYAGEFIALLFFGSRIFSFDRLVFGAKKALRRGSEQVAEKFKEYEIALLRVTYGISVLYPAITVKFFHPQVIVDIANRYHLNQIHWLFPQDPLLISLGAGAAQILVGFCIIVGFETRLNSFITFALYILSILFFKEVVWPHYILLALAFYLVTNDGGKLTLDNLIQRWFARRRL